MNDDGYTNEPTHVRIFSDALISDPQDRTWFIDGADDSGAFTEACWSYGSRAAAVDALPKFVSTQEANGVRFLWRDQRRQEVGQTDA